MGRCSASNSVGACLRRVTIAQSISEMERLKPLWKQLCDCSPGATMFQSYELNALAARSFTREHPFVVSAETDSGAAIIPASMSDGGLTLLGDCMFDYRDVLSAGDLEALTLACEAIAGRELPLSFDGLRGDVHPDFWQQFECTRWCSAPGVPRSIVSADEFCAAHTRLGSRYRKLERAGATLHRYNGSDSALLRWLFEQKARQHSFGGAQNLFADPVRREFMLAWCDMAGCGCDIYCLETDSEIISALVTFRDEFGTGHSSIGSRRFYMIYFNPKWEKFSPGTVLVYEVTRQTLAQKLDADFMTGEQPHKLRMAADAVPLYSVRAMPESLNRVSEYALEAADEFA